MSDTQLALREKEQQRIERSLARLDRLSRLMDDQFELPLVKVRVGLGNLMVNNIGKDPSRIKSTRLTRRVIALGKCSKIYHSGAQKLSLEKMPFFSMLKIQNLVLVTVGQFVPGHD